MRIESFQDMVEQCGLPQKILDGIGARLSASTGGAPFQFTGLQRKAFEHEAFWSKRADRYDPKHIILQGATSAGKTLISEIAILECLYLEPKKKAIVLVPLKAMVRERCGQLERDLPGKHIYASSSDFLDHDVDIINGNYDVAVIVYEKFFAMLSQAANAILKNCSLLVVDELQMLSSEGRGPKLEISIQKVMRHNAELGSEQAEGTYTRIMCLTTCDCRVSYIEKWLTVNGEPPALILYEKRPVGLEEYVVQLDGRMQGRYVAGERDPDDHEQNFSPNPEPLPLTVRSGLNSMKEIYDAKRRLLCTLVKQLCQQEPAPKILVFIADKKETVKVAQYLKTEGVFPHRPLSEELQQKLEEYDGDDNQRQLAELFSYGIAFHNASMMASLRELVETQLMSDGEDGLNLVVATETLTIGMNMPVDVMILFDHEVPRGTQRCSLTSQEYKNFVGRAGRLGLSNRVGKSYLIVRDEEERENLWQRYVCCSKEEISSALIYANEEVQAPYYLSLLTPSRFYSVTECEQMQDSSFSQASGGRRISMEKLMQKLKQATLVRQEQLETDFDDVDDDMGEAECRYHLSDLGRQMAPYALSLETDKELRRVFLNGGFRRKKDGRYQENLAPGKGGLPLNITTADLENDRYLLDILYVLCQQKEVTTMGQLRLPSGDNGRIVKQGLYEQLKKMIQLPLGEEGHSELWPQSALAQLESGLCEDEEKEYQALMRAILLWYWTKGKRISEMRKCLPFTEKISLYSGDLARIAEVVSYQLDAVYHCAINISQSIKVRFDERGPRAIYALSTRVNYGMPRDLVIIANRHVYGLDRQTVLNIGAAAKQYGYDSPAAYLARSTHQQRLRIVTENQRCELLSRIERIYLRDDFDSLLSGLQDNPKGSVDISENEVMALKQFYASKFSEESLSLMPLEHLFWTKEQTLSDKSDSHKYFSQQVVLHNLEHSLGQLAIANRLVLNLGCFAQGADCQRVARHFKSKQPNERNLLLVDSQSLLELVEWNGASGWFQIRDEEGHIQLENVDLAMTFRSFAALLAHTVAMNDRNGMLLSALLKDVDGAFAPKGIKEIYHLLKNYEATSDKTPGWPAVRLVWDWRLLDQEAGSKLLQALTNHGIPFQRVSWGAPLEEENPQNGAVALTVLYLSRESQESSRSVKEFCEKFRAYHYQDVLALFDSEEQFQNWAGDPAFPPQDLRHYLITDIDQTALYISKMCQQALVQKEAGSRNESFLIGISYSHAKEQGEERPASRWLRTLVDQLNQCYGKDQILYDGNQPHWFDGGNAIPETLERYRHCAYFIILDDHYYTFGGNCLREYETIQEVLKQQPDRRRKVWFLRPNNEKASTLFDPSRDYCHAIEFNTESMQSVLDVIKQTIQE